MLHIGVALDGFLPDTRAFGWAVAALALAADRLTKQLDQYRQTGPLPLFQFDCPARTFRYRPITEIQTDALPTLAPRCLLASVRRGPPAATIPRTMRFSGL
jgi:hypothetical protein